MLSPLDDQPVHESGRPLLADGAHPDLVERYELLAFDTDAGPGQPRFVGARLSVHPGRSVIDASVSVLIDGRQRSLHTSGRWDATAARLAVGPIALDLVEPMRRSSIVADAPELGVEARLEFVADGLGSSYQEPDRHVVWHRGSVAVGLDLDGTTSGADHTLPAFRRRTWGVVPRPGEAWGAPSHEEPQFFRYAAALDVHGRLVVVAGDEHADGWTRWASTSVGDEPARHQLQLHWEPSTRWLRDAAVEILERSGHVASYALEVVARIPARGLGIASPEWSEGVWHDELASGTESWSIDELDPADIHHVHNLYVVRATTEGQPVGTGLLDLVAVGPHAPSGLRGFADGA